jgi:hypothetical protein
VRVRFKVNLGSKDARSIGVDYRQCCEGATVDVPAKAGEWLCKHGIATKEPEPEPEPPKVQAVPPVEAVRPAPPEIKSAGLSAKIKPRPSQ